LPVPVLLATCYIAWLVLHQMVTDIGVPNRSDNDPSTNDDLIYPAVGFEDKKAFSSVLVVAVVFLFVPLIHWLLWSLSLYSLCPFSCRGNNRRYLPATTGEVTLADNIEEPSSVAYTKKGRAGP